MLKLLLNSKMEKCNVTWSLSLFFFSQIQTPSKTLGPFCGRTPPTSPLITHSHHVKVLFATDGFGTNRGFSLSFRVRGAAKCLHLQATDLERKQAPLVENVSSHFCLYCREGVSSSGDSTLHPTGSRISAGSDCDCQV